MKPISGFPRVKLGHLPTPLEPLRRLSAELGGPEIWIKRDDCTGLATGGNKTRKLEFLMGQAEREGADTVVTFGALQSNHARQTAAAAARLGLHCVVFLVRKVTYSEAAYQTSGNLLLDDLLGAQVEIADDEAALAERLSRVGAELRAQGRTAYMIPPGGSNTVGALGYVNCALEIDAQCRELGIEPSAVVHASSSGGTQAGLVAGFAALQSAVSVQGINVSDKDAKRIVTLVEGLCRETCEAIGIRAVGGEQIRIDHDYIGPDYGIPTDAMREAVRLAAAREGILLDPVYTGKAMAGLIGLIRAGVYRRGETVVFVHTGGSAGLFAYRDALTGQSDRRR
ncbi:MAG: D-cysteine desulfhydrase [Myxococcota bacterium]